MSIINRFYGAITGGTIGKLQEIVNGIHDNSDQKDALREMSELVLQLKERIRSGNMEKAAELMEQLKGLAAEAGLSAGDPLMAMLNSLDTKALASRDEPFSREELRAWEDFFKDFDAALDLEIDQRADISSKQQTDLNTYSSQLRQSEQAISDIDSRWNTAIKDVIGNMRA
jgi:hypothetical protein